MGEWKTLPLNASRKDSPPLYIQAEVQDSSYTVYLTDLIYIWAEKLDRRAIMRRAMDEETTIDPTNGVDQLKQLLDHISGCLTGKIGTSAIFSSQSTKEQLKLTLLSKLPAPLEPLRWPMVLALEDQPCFSSELLWPALDTLSDYRSGLLGLRAVIRDKDTVIQKLQDKLEEAGVDLGSVFPGSGLGKAKGPGKAPNRIIPGLKDFNYDLWVNSTLSKDPISNDTLPRVADSDLVTTTRGTPWWENIPTSDAEDETHVSDSQANGSRNSNFSIPERQRSFRQPSVSSTSSEGGDSSIVEATADASTKRAAPQADVVVESSHDSSSFESRHEKIDNEVEDRSAPPKRIGKLGGKKEAPSMPEPVTKPPESVQEEPRSGTQISPPKKGKLGKIGGRSKASDPRGGDTATEQILSTGLPGHSVKREPPVDDGTPASVGADYATREERETSQERADRRRAELKRQMEEKKKAPAAKKKQRKF